MKKNIKNYYPGKGCECFANHKWECVCKNVDWTPLQVYQLKELLQEAVDFYILSTSPSEKWWIEAERLGIKKH